MNKYDIESFTAKIGSQACANIFSITDEWIKLFKKQHGEFPQSSKDVMILESHYLTKYLLSKKIKFLLTNDDYKLFDEYIDDTFIVALMAYFESPVKEKDIIKHRKLIEEFYFRYINESLSYYQDNPENSLEELFKIILLVKIFNQKENPIKFIEKKFNKLLSAKISQFLYIISGEKDRPKYRYFDIKILEVYVNNIVNSIDNIEPDKFFITS